MRVDSWVDPHSLFHCCCWRQRDRRKNQDGFQHPMWRWRLEVGVYHLLLVLLLFHGNWLTLKPLCSPSTFVVCLLTSLSQCGLHGIELWCCNLQSLFYNSTLRRYQWSILENYAANCIISYFYKSPETQYTPWFIADIDKIWCISGCIIMLYQTLE